MAAWMAQKMSAQFSPLPNVSEGGGESLQQLEKIGLVV